MWRRWIFLLLWLPNALAWDLNQFMTQLGYQTVPLFREEEDGNHLRLHAKVNGKRVSILVDTGAPFTCAREDFAARAMPLKAGGAAAAYFCSPLDLMTNQAGFLTMNSGNVRSNVPIVLLRRLELGAMTFEDVPAVASYGKRARPGRGNELLLGADFLLRYHAVIACLEHTLYLRESPVSAADALRFDDALRDSSLTEVRLAFVPRYNRWVVPAAAGTSEFPLLLDTGAFLSMIDEEFARQLGWPLRKSTMSSWNLYSKSNAMQRAEVTDFRVGQYRLKKVYFGAFDLKNLGLGVDREGHSTGNVFAHRPVVGLLGMELLSLNLGLIDCGRHKLWLRWVADQ